MAQLIAMEKRIAVLQVLVEKVLDILHVEPNKIDAQKSNSEAPRRNGAPADIPLRQESVPPLRV